MNVGQSVDKKEFNTRKNQKGVKFLTIGDEEPKTKKLEENLLFFDKSIKETMRYPKGYWGKNKE